MMCGSGRGSGSVSGRSASAYASVCARSHCLGHGGGEKVPLTPAAHMWTPLCSINVPVRGCWFVLVGGRVETAGCRSVDAPRVTCPGASGGSVGRGRAGATVGGSRVAVIARRDSMSGVASGTAVNGARSQQALDFPWTRTGGRATGLTWTICT